MALSCRAFVVARDDTLYRVSNAKFAQMLHDPRSYPMPQFAGERMRMASIVVSILDRRPMQVVRTTYCILPFDSDGYLDTEQVLRREAARAEPLFASVFGKVDDAAGVVDAESRFVARGGRWTPSNSLARLIGEAALDRVKYARL